MKKIKRIGALSLGKILGVMYTLMGLAIGGLMAIFMVLGAVLFSSESGNWGILFGVAAIVVIPAFYGALGFLFGAFFAWLFNVCTNIVGGLEIEFCDESGATRESGSDSTDKQDLKK